MTITNYLNVFMSLVLYPITKIPMRVEKRLCSVHKELKQFRLDSQQKTAM